ncbi:MAG: hypothetical protein JSR85_05670 [Proteobacteria bacterium]|nr:hypothetical protein [Pseudomonadota bacterium]
MNFTVISLLSLLSFTSLVTSPAMSIDSDEEDAASSSPIPSPRAATPTAEQNELDLLLSTQNYPAAFASLRGTLPPTLPDEEIVKFLLSSNGYSKYDSLSLAEKKWVANRIATKEVDIVDTTPKSPASPRSSSPAPVSADPSATASSTPTKVAKAPLDAGIMAEVDAYRGALKDLGNLSLSRKVRNGVATRTGPSKELANHLRNIRGLLPLVITLDPDFDITNFKDASNFVSPKAKLNVFTLASANAKLTLPNGVKPAELLLEVATLIQNIMEQNPGDTEAEEVYAMFVDILADQGDCQLPALSGRLAYVYSAAFNYLVKKYNAGI